MMKKCLKLLPLQNNSLRFEILKMEFELHEWIHLHNKSSYLVKEIQ